MSLEAILKIKGMAEGALKAVEQVQSGMGKMAEQATRLGQRMSVGVTAPIVAGLGLATNQAIGFESAMADVTKVLGDSAPADFDRTLLQMSRNIPIAAEGLAAIAASGGQLGVAAGDIAEFTEITAQMSTAFDMSAGQAGDSIAKLMTVMNLSNMDDVRQVGDLFNHLSDNSGASAAALVDVATRTAGISQTFGLANNEIAALNAAFIEMAPSPEIAATAINSMLPALQTATGQAPKFQDALMEVGLTASDIVQMIERDAMGGLQNFLGSLGQLDETARANVIRDMFGSGSDAALINTLAGDTSILADNLATVADMADFGGSMMREFENRSATTANQLQLLRNNMSEVGITIGSVILPPLNHLIDRLRPMLEGFANFAQANPNIVAVGVAIAGLAAAAGPVLVAVGTIGTLLAGVSAPVLAIAAAIAVALPLVIAYLPQIMQFLNPLIQKVQEFLPRIQTFLTNLITKVREFVTGFWEGFQPFITQIMPHLQSIKESLGTLFTNAATNLGNFLTKLGELAGRFLPISTEAEGFGNTVGAALGKILSGLLRLISGTLRVVAAFSTMASNILSTVQNLAGKMAEAGANIVKSLAQGITGAIGFVIDAMSQVTGRIAGFGPGSPVKEGPLTAYNSLSTNPMSKLMDMMAAGIQSNPLTPALNSALSPGTFGAQSAGSSFNAGGITVNVSVQGGGSDAETARNLGDELRRVLPDVLDSVMADKQRVGYAG